MKKKYLFIVIAFFLVGFGIHAKPAFATTGNMYVVDNGYNSVQIRSATGTYLSQFGAGSNNGLVYPYRSAFDGSGNLWVIDQYAEAIKKFIASGTTYVYSGIQFGSYGSPFYNPVDIAFDSGGNMWINDDGAHVLDEYVASGTTYKYSTNFSTNGGQGMSINASGRFLVAEQGYVSGLVDIYSSTGTLINTFGATGSSCSGQFTDITSIVATGTSVFVSDNQNGCVEQWTASGTTYVFKTAFGNSGLGQMDQPAAVTVDGGGNVWAADGDLSKSRVVEFVASGTTYAYSKAIGSPGTGNTNFNEPMGITFDSSGNVYVTDSGNNRISKFNSSGSFVAQFGSSGNGYFNDLEGIGQDSSGNVWLLSAGDNNVEEFSSSGVYMSQFSLGAFGLIQIPSGLAVDPNNNLWVTDLYGGIQEYSPTGTLGVSLTTSGSNCSAGNINYPNSPTFDSAGHLWVIQNGNQCVEEFSATGTIMQSFSRGSDFSGVALAFDGSGNLWVSDDGASTSIDEFSSTGSFINSFSVATSAGPNEGIEGLAFDSNGKLWATDESGRTNGDNGIDEFSTAGALLFSTGTFGQGGPYIDTASRIIFATSGGGGSPSVSSFSASPTIVASAGTSTLSWTVSNASSVAISPIALSTSTLIGSTTVNPTVTTAYTLTATNPNGTSTATTSVMVGATNISSAAAQHWAWNDKIGWIDFYDTQNIIVSSTSLTGYASSSAGYISLDCGTSPNGNICTTRNSNYGVSNDGSGNLSGWAWNDMYGWISFCGNSSGGGSTWNGSKWVCPSSPTYQVVINPTSGIFSGWAWNDTIGWISFNCSNTGNCGSPSQYDVVTSWIGANGTTTTGTLDSETFDTGVSSGAQLNSVTWQGTAPASTTVGFQFAVSASSTGPWTYAGLDGTSGTMYTGLAGAPIPLSNYPSLKGRYFRYHIILITNGSGTVTPSVQGVSVNWSP